MKWVQRLGLVAGLGFCFAAGCKPGPSNDPAADTEPEVKVAARSLSVQSVHARVQGARFDSHFRHTTIDEREAVLRAMSLLRPPRDEAPSPSKAAQLLRSVGLELEVWTVQEQRYYVIFQSDGRKRAAGFYLLRIHETPQPRTLLLQAPHPRYDRETADLALGLFFAPNSPLQPDGLFVATGHRFRPRPDERELDDSPSDLAHNPYHLFTVVTAAVGRTSQEFFVVSLHGFADQKSGKLQAVVSAGRVDRSSVWATQVAKRLRDRWGKGVRLYPTQVSHLGGTTNAQSRYLEGRFQGHFLHLELSNSLRKQLRKSAARAALAADLALPEDKTP